MAVLKLLKCSPYFSQSYGMRAWIERLANYCWYQATWTGVLLAPFSAVFALLAGLRRQAYRLGWLGVYRSPAKVVVVGNISVGGTGKTPVVIALLDYLRSQSIKAVVVSRGYGRVSKELLAVQANTPASQCGDEPLLIFLATGVPVVVASTRIEAVRYCEQHYPDHWIISDDGLQHYALARDIEIAVVDGVRVFGNGRLLPAGPLREPVTRLSQVDFILVNGGHLPGAYSLTLAPLRVIHLKSRQEIAVDRLAELGPWLAVTAIGHPQRFFDTLRMLKLRFDEKIFPDHYLYQASDFEAFATRPIMVTAKDAVKLQDLALTNVYVLEVGAVLPEAFYEAFFTKTVKFMTSIKTIAVVGATGLVGSTLLQLLAAKAWPAMRLCLVASDRSAGKTLSYQGQALTVQDIANFDFAKVDLAFFAAGSDVAKHYGPKAVAAGCWVIDKSSYFRTDPDVPLIVPSVNFANLNDQQPGLIAVPNCSTIPLAMVLQPIAERYGLKRVTVATYQSVSGAGTAGIAELACQLQAAQAERPLEAKHFSQPILHNVIACIDAVTASGYTKEELKLQYENRKILNLPELIVDATAVRVPVWYGHAEAVSIETEQAIDLAELSQLLAGVDHVTLLTLPELPNPLEHADQAGTVWIGRLRQMPEDSRNRVSLWLLANNITRGAALTAVEIAERLGVFREMGEKPRV